MPLSPGYYCVTKSTGSALIGTDARGDDDDVDDVEQSSSALPLTWELLPKSAPVSLPHPLVRGCRSLSKGPFLFGDKFDLALAENYRRSPVEHSIVGASARPSGRSDFPSPSSPFSRLYEDGQRESRRRVSDGTIACELGAGGGDEKEEDVYDFLASRSSRRRHSSSSKKLRDKTARKLTPKDQAPMTLEERTAEILARTRSTSSAAPVSVAGGGEGGVGGNRKGDTTSPAGGAGARGGDGAGTFSDFAKSLREFQGDLDLSAATTGGAISKTAEREPRESEALLQMSRSLIDEADMEVGGYARARRGLRQSKKGMGATASASARSRSSPAIAGDATGALPREKIPGTLAMRSEGSDDCTREGVASGGDGQGQVTDAGRKGTGCEGGEAGSDTCYEDDGFEAEVEEEEDKEEDREKGEKVEPVGGEAWKVLSRGGTEDNDDVDGDGDGRCEGADVRESSRPLRFQGASTNSSTGDAVGDGGEGERGEGAGGFHSGAEASIVGATSPRYLLANVAVSGRVFPTSPGGRSSLSLPPAPPDSPPPSPLSASFVAVAAAAVPAAEDKQSTGGRALAIDRTSAKRHSNGKSVSEAGPARGEEGTCGLASAPPPPRHPLPGDGGGRDHCDIAIDVRPASHEVESDAILSLRRDQNQRDRSGAALDVAGLGRDDQRQLRAPVSGREVAATPAPAPVPALEPSFVLSEGRFDSGGSRSSTDPHYRRSDGSPPPVSSPSRSSGGGGAGVRSTRDRRPQSQGQRVGAPRGDWRTGGSHAALSGLSCDDVGPGFSASVSGQEEQLGTLSPLGGGGCASARRRASSIQKYSSSERGRFSNVGNISTDVGFADRERSRAVVGYLDADAAEREQARSRKGQARGENRQHFGHAGSAAAVDDLQGPADVSSVVLMSSLSSTPGRRRSGPDPWAAGHDQASTGRADLAVGGLSAANCWKKTTVTPQAERGFQDGAGIVMRAQEKPTAERRRRQSPVPTAAARYTEDSGPMQRQQQQLLHLEADRRREETERELEKARAEIYALQVKLKEKRAVTPARTPTVRDHGIGGRVRGAAGDRERNSFGGVSSRGKGKENGRKPVGGDATPVVAEVVTVQAAALASMEALRAEAEGMRREIAEQDRLLSAYQKENEKLLERAKKDKAEHEEERLSLYRDRERLNKELNRLANEKCWAGTGAVNGRRSANAVQARLQAEAEIVEERARQADLTLEVDRLRTVEKALEAKAAQAAAAQASAEAKAAKALSARAATGAPSSAAEGLFGSEALVKLEGEVERLEGLLTREREEREEETTAARKRLDWYAGNQELLDSHLEKMREQEKELDRLRQALSSRKAGGKGAVGRSPSDVRKIKDLEAQLGELAEALRKRHPDSLASLIRAARPTESQDMRNQNHLRKIRELETELARNKEESELRLRALRQQHERLKIGMEKRLEATKRSGREGVGGGFGLRAARAGVGGSTGFTQRAKSRGEGSGVHKYNEQQQQSPQPKQQGRVVEELEKELGRVRSFYTRKLKEMERRAETQMRALKRGGSGRGGGDSNRLGAEDGRSVHGRDDDDDAARMTRRDEADGKLRPPGGKREHQSSATTTAAAATGGRVGTHGARSSPPPFAGRLGGDGIAASSSAAFGSPSAPAASSPPVRQTASSDENRRTSCRDPREAAGHRQDGEPGARKCDNSELGLGSEESIGSNIADVLKAERARHERELEREREAAAARVAALELRLVQTAQALGKAQAREQAELWGRGRARLSVYENNVSADTRGRGEDLVEARARERERHQQQQQQQEKARELELKIAIARERQAAAAKDLERSEDMRKALEVEVLGLRAKLNEPSTPSQAKYLDLSRKMEEMERRTARREAELQRVLSESREHSKLELRRLQALHAEEMRAKDALVHGFRAELDVLMMAAGRLMEGGGSGGKAERIATDRPIGSGADGTEPAWGMVS